MHSAEVTVRFSVVTHRCYEGVDEMDIGILDSGFRLIARLRTIERECRISQSGSH